jgi:hypothetical protein
VVVIALGILSHLYRLGRPLAERLTWLGLDQFVPTAGFEADSVTKTFDTRLALTAARSAATTSAGRREPTSRPVQPVAGTSTPTLAVAATVAAGSSETVAPAGDTVLAPAAAPVPPEVTVLAPPASVASEAKATEATVVDPIENGETIVANPKPPNEPRTTEGKEETR